MLEELSLAALAGPSSKCARKQGGGRGREAKK